MSRHIEPPELFESTSDNNLPEVRRLLRAGADVNAKHKFGGETPLHRASTKGHVQVVIELLEHGAGIEAKDIFGMTPLDCACNHGHLAVVNELLGLNDSNGAASIFLDKRKHRRRADTEAKNKKGKTPLQFAILKDHLPVVKSLLAAGVDICAINNNGILPIHQALIMRNSEMVKCLLEHFYVTIRRLPLHALLDDLTWMKNHTFSVGLPPVRIALHTDVLRTDHVVEMVEYLIEQNPALLSCSRDQDGALPLHVACRRGASFAIVESLVNHCKASVTSVTPQGDLPLFLACEMPDTSLDTIFTLVKLSPNLVYRSL
jgi:ankyrin repeat protein